MSRQVTIQVSEHVIRRTATAVLLLAAALTAAAAHAWAPATRTSEAAAQPQQDVIRLESRLSRLEQRFYSVEASIRALEQQPRLPDPAAARPARDPEVSLLLTEVEALRRRLAEVECGLTKIDERTLTPAAREERRKSAGGGADPCRLGVGTPVRLSARP
jgi:hypothetical protein